MKVRLKIAQSCVCLLVTLACADLHAMMEADKFIGAWRLVAAEFRAEDGAIAESPYGPEPQGLLMYDAHGSMAAQLAQTGRRAFAVADRMAGTTDEIKAAFESYQAYYGRYRIDEREHVVTHTVTQALLPNWIGTEQRRQYKFKDGRLILRTPPILIGGKRLTGELVWEKIKLGK
ncbi:MAG TPA: lipocalin-like domain-containing protein [Burkholderiales bacterium]|nr:lipocalin-like domain-containing protein [Burkholderiales bacterium]